MPRRSESKTAGTDGKKTERKVYTWTHMGTETEKKEKYDHHLLLFECKELARTVKVDIYDGNQFTKAIVKSEIFTLKCNVKEKKSGGFFLSMPSYKKKDGTYENHAHIDRALSDAISAALDELWKE